MSLTSKNPATEEIIKNFQELSTASIEKKIVLAYKAFQSWKKTSFFERKKYLSALSSLLQKRKKELAMTVTTEMGKPIRAAVGEIEKCALTCQYFAQHAELFLKDELIQSDTSKSYVRFDPLGVILAIMPWNFPFWQVIRAAAPSIMAGNVVLLKHASNVSQCSLLLQEIYEKAGFSKGVFQSLLTESDKVNNIIAHPYVQAVTLTGSLRAGSQVAQHAGFHIKKTVLELGGSDPFIILNDVDLQKAVEAAVSARLQNTGQSCIAAKRFIVVKKQYEEFVERLKHKFADVVIGDPTSPQTQLGPLATEQILNEVERQVQKSIRMGARLIIGGKRKKGKGYYYMPTILTNLTKAMPVYKEEVFGPVASVIMASDVNDAIAIANDTSFGLAASLWTKNITLAKKIAPHIEAGAVFINGMVKSDPRLPFGGVKKSGYGRELSAYGIKEFVNIKTVSIQ